MLKNVILVMIGLMVLASSANALGPFLYDGNFEAPDVDPGIGNGSPIPFVHGEAVTPPTTNVWMDSYGGVGLIYEKAAGEISMGDAPQGSQMLLNSAWEVGSDHGSRSNYITDYILQEGDVIGLSYWCYIASSTEGMSANIMCRNWESEGYWDNVSSDTSIRYEWQFVSGVQAPVPAGNAGEHLYIQTNSWANYGTGVCFDDIHLFINGEDVTIPEPMTLTLLGLGGLALVRRRR